MLEFEALLRSYADRVEGYLHSCFTDADEPQQVLFDAMRYSLLTGGKRLRPVLVREACRLGGGDPVRALPLAYFASLWISPTFSRRLTKRSIRCSFASYSSSSLLLRRTISCTPCRLMPRLAATSLSE